MIADLSGFTKLTTWLGEVIGRGQGPAQINAVVNSFFRPLVDCIEAHGGDVIKFAGDALIVEWSAPKAEGRGGGELEGHSGRQADADARGVALRATLAAQAGRCALAMAHLEAPIERRATGVAGELMLALHTSLACGDVAALHVGGVANRYEFFITGRQVRPI